MLAWIWVVFFLAFCFAVDSSRLFVAWLGFFERVRSFSVVLFKD